jgi:hypothetical protein
MQACHAAAMGEKQPNSKVPFDPSSWLANVEQRFQLQVLLFRKCDFFSFFFSFGSRRRPLSTVSAENQLLLSTAGLGFCRFREVERQEPIHN